MEADTKAGEKNFRHQLKMLWPNKVEKILNKSPTTVICPLSSRQVKYLKFSAGDAYISV